MNKTLAATAYLAVLGIVALITGVAAADDSLLGRQWKRNALATKRFEIQGTGGRNNPLRRQLIRPFTNDELFVRYRIRYHASSIDSPPGDTGEFFVLWLDVVEGNDGSTHSAGIPNVGIHVSGDENRFMVRYGPGSQKFGPKLEGDREFQIVARLWKSTPGKDQPFDQLSLWIDPKTDAEFSPDTSTRSAKSITAVHWIGFSTGAKTEIEDRIEVWDIDLADTWEAILDLPPRAEPDKMRPTEKPRTIDFAKHVFPILESRCFACHCGDDASEGVRLDVWDEVLNQTSPRNAAASQLYQLVVSGKMPPEGDELTREELDVIRTWIDEGVQWDESLLPTPTPKTTHWAFQPIHRPATPKISNRGWVRTPVDAFIARRHQQAGLVPAPGASTATLTRRLSLDLLGLPPNKSSSPDVDRFLNDPAYGQRWGRHWLDVARWAESNGHQHNRLRPHAWRYRDWVIDAFNNDKPFDRFVREQIAGDELEPCEDENLVATGFLAAARYSGNELDKEIQRNHILVDITNTTAQAFLGLTLECAQCHTHKFDPLSIRDYYRFQAFFAKGQPANVVFAKSQKLANELIDERWRIFDSVHSRLVTVKRKQGHPEPIYVIPKSVVAGMNAKEKSRFNQLEKSIGALEQTWAFYSPVTGAQSLPIAPSDMRWPLPRDPGVLKTMRSNLLIRGDVRSPGPEVSPGWPAVFGPASASGTGRLTLADWLTSSSNPLTARVWVNRIWQWHFGRGIVETSGDFGTQGTQPSHPELLDYLASELISSGWSTKHIHRLILNSSTYRQSSRFSADNAAIDPDNKLHWRWTPRRLEAEAIRDSILEAAGQLDKTAGGPSDNAQSNRRSVYLKQRRDNFPHQQMLFDSAAGIVTCSRRRVSTTALQPLWLMNSNLIQQATTKFADRAGSAERAIEIAFGRPATNHELANLQPLVKQYGLKSACLAIMNSNEFLYIP